MTIQLYECKCEPRVVNKRTGIVPKDSKITGQFRSSVNVQNPEIMIEGTAISKDCNYCFIEELDRYYYIDSITSERNNITVLNCRVDVLYTYATYLNECYGLIDRAEKHVEGPDEEHIKSAHNRYVYDSEFVREAPNAIVHLPFTGESMAELAPRLVLLTVYGAVPVETPEP